MIFHTQAATAIKAAMTQRTADITLEAQKAIPALTIVGAGTLVNLQNWVYVVTIIYVALQAAYLIWKWRRESISPPASTVAK